MSTKSHELRNVISRDKRMNMEMAAHRSVSRRQVWIGLVHVAPQSKDNKFFHGAQGAYVNTLVWALDKREFLTKLGYEFSQSCMKMLKVEDMEPLKQRMNNYRLPKTTIRVAQDAQQSRGVRFTTFCMYPAKNRRRPK